MLQINMIVCKVYTNVSWLFSRLSDINHVNNFVDNDYKKAVNHQYQSLHNPKSDQFFVEINEIVKFDYNVKGFDSHKETFKALLEDYQEALKVYAKQSI